MPWFIAWIFVRVECHTIVAELYMECVEKELELGNWNSIIVFGCSDMQLSIISILLLREAKRADNVCYLRYVGKKYGIQD